MRKAITFVFAWFVLSAAYLAVGAPKYTPTIPPGYSGEVVLHVDYGKTPDKIRVD
ncbi:MAG: hypothetical protein GTN78_18475, partial [Gemmatimonadales bacterium]|nr:hypothetical protein [Gemmatimonadales bacterium]